MRKLIYQSEIGELVCDNPECDFRCEIESKDYHEFINAECPKCGENLLTLKDYNLYLKMIKIVNRINRWFSWITIFIKEPSERERHKVHVHNGSADVKKGNN
jgi:ssDNA-binding Zn-finger/Zn-ribbon topoisomerase 1